MSATRHNAFQRLFRGETSYDFVGRWRVWFGISAVIILIGIVSLATRGLNFSIEFKGGTVWEVPSTASVAHARKALRARPSTLGHDVLAWNLYRAGKVSDAAKESVKALALGTNDPQERFHAAAIEFANGDRVKAAADLKIVLSENPRFSAALAPEVSDLARRLGL